MSYRGKWLLRALGFSLGVWFLLALLGVMVARGFHV